MKTHKIIQILFLSLTFLVLTMQASALVAIQISVKQQFKLGETVSFGYIFKSDKDETIDYIASVKCPNTPMTVLYVKTAKLKENIIFKEEYTYIKVSEDIEPQKCKAIVSITKPFEITETQDFEIVTDPSFEFEVALCKDQYCMERSKVFVRNSDTYLGYDSEVKNPSVTATLTLPDKITQQLTLPTSIKAEQIGTYELEVKASKEGYKTITKKEQFGVIEKEVEIEFAGVCGANGKCDGEENYQNCPQDCLVKKGVNKIWIILLIVVILISIIAVILIRRKRKVQF